MLKTHDLDFELYPTGWSVFKVASSSGRFHYYIFSDLNNVGYWSKKIDIQNEFIDCEDEFIWKNNSTITSHFKKSNEGNISDTQQIELDVALKQMKQQWITVEHVLLQDVLNDA